MKGKRGKAGKTKELTRRAKIIIGAIAAPLFIAVFMIIDWRTQGHFEPQELILAIGIVIFFLLLFVLPSFRRWCLDTIGENDNSIKKRPWRFFVALAISFIFFFYILSSESQVTVPSSLQFNIIIVSSTLGGLVLAATTISRGKRAKRRELLSVAQKLIMATLLFVFFTALFFIVESIGGIDQNSFELANLLNWFRGAFFWSAIVSIYTGGILFSLGIIDLVIALTHMRRDLTRKIA